MAAFFEDSGMDQISKGLEEIESKYSPLKNEGIHSSIISNDLKVLSRELDCVGLQPLNLDNPLSELLEQIVHSSRALVQIHRNSIRKSKVQSIEARGKNLKCNELYDRLESYKSELEKAQLSNANLECKINRMNNEIVELQKRERHYKDQLERVKRSYLSKQSELQHNLRKLKKENERVRGTVRLASRNTANEAALTLLEKQRAKEDIYKSTIKQLDENNRELLDECLSLKEQTILCTCKKKFEINKNVF